MKHPGIVLAALLCLFSLHIFSEKIVRIEGQELQQELCRIHFSGDTAVLHFAQGDSLSTLCVLLSIEFTKESGLSPLSVSDFLLARQPIRDQVLLNNLEVGMDLVLYDIQGRLIKKQLATSDSEQIDLQGLPPGVYLLRAGKCLIRFVKQ